MKGYVPFAINKIEVESHFLLDCKDYSKIRDEFISKLELKIPSFKSLSHDTLIAYLANSSDYLTVKWFYLSRNALN